MNRIEKASTLYNEGFSCSQAVLGAFCEEYGLPGETALRLSQGFGGGMAGTAGVCGAVTGGILVIGLKNGKRRPDDQAAKKKTYDLVRTLFERFRRRHGSLLCRYLLNCDIGKPDGASKARENGLHKRLCPLLIESAVEIVEEIL